MSYHVNNNGDVGLCKAKKRPCPFGGDEVHYANAELARKAFEESQSGSFGSADFSLSKVCDENGKLLTVFHGTEGSFDSFDSSFLGAGIDAYGSGFYFTTDRATARGYGKNLKEVQLLIKNPIVASGRAGSLQELHIAPSKALAILRKHPDIYLNSSEAEAQDKFNPLGDYFSEYWDRDDWSHEQMDAMVQRLAREYFSGPGNYTYLENFFGSSFVADFRKSVTEVTGWDGVRIDFEDGLTHWVAWSPEQIRTVSVAPSVAQ